MNLKVPKISGATVKGFAKSAGRFLEKNAPVIFAGIAIGGLIASVGAAIKAAPEVQQALEEAEIKKNEQALKERMEDGNDQTPIVSLTWKESLPIYFKYYWKTGVLVILSATCMICSVRSANKQIRAFAVLAAAAESNLTNLEDAGRSLIGDKKFDAIKRKVVNDEMADNPPDEEFITVTGAGNTLCYEPYFKTYFRMSIEEADRCAMEVERQYNRYDEVTYDDIYEIFKLQTPKNLEERISSLTGSKQSSDISLIKEFGYFKDPDAGREYAPKWEPWSTDVILNGHKETCYVIQFNKPKSRLEWEVSDPSVAAFRDFGYER